VKILKKIIRIVAVILIAQLCKKNDFFNLNNDITINMDINNYRWGYDSYCYDEVWDYVGENSPKQIDDDIRGYLSDIVDWNDLDFVIGIAMHRIRSGIVLKDETLRKLREVIDDILARSPFDCWDDKNKRIIKLQHERRIINAVLKKMNLKFGELIQPPVIID
jgi:hypothetical protein